MEISFKANFHRMLPFSLLVPTIPSGNIHAPTVMVAEKGADLIKELWLQEEVIRSEAQAATSLANNQFNIIPANPTAPYY